jgi:hypothetical protein
MPTQQEIDKVKLNLSNLIDLNNDILINGNLKIDNAGLLLSIKDDHDLGVQIGINLLTGAFWGLAAWQAGFMGALAANFCCGVISHYTNSYPPSLQSSVANLKQRLQVTSIQFQYDLEKFYADPTTYWDVEYCGNVVNAFGTYPVCGKLSDLSTVDVPAKTDPNYTKNLVQAVFGLDQVVWDNLLRNFVITETYPALAYYVKYGYTEEKMESNASSYYLSNPSYWLYWEYEQAKGFWGGDKSAYWQTDYNIGSGWSLTSDGHLSDEACNYLFSDLYNGVPNPNMAISGGLYTREFVFNNMPHIKRVSKYIK